MTAAIVTILKLISCAVTGGLVFRSLREVHQSTWIGKTAAMIVFFISVAFAFSAPDFVDATSSIETEKEFWRSVENHPSEQMYRLYLKKYPDGEFREIAETLLKEMVATKPASVPATPVITTQVLESPTNKNAPATAEVIQNVEPTAEQQLEQAQAWLDSNDTAKYSNAVKLLQPMVNEGNTKAINLLAASYFFGLGVIKDEKRGCQLYKQAIDANNTDEQEFYDKKCRKS